jgi:hypothetical protein
VPANALLVASAVIFMLLLHFSVATSRPATRPDPPGRSRGSTSSSRRARPQQRHGRRRQDSDNHQLHAARGRPRLLKRTRQAAPRTSDQWARSASAGRVRPEIGRRKLGGEQAANSAAPIARRDWTSRRSRRRGATRRVAPCAELLASPPPRSTRTVAQPRSAAVRGQQHEQGRGWVRRSIAHGFAQVAPLRRPFSNSCSWSTAAQARSILRPRA